ncbi:hypothetical protein ACFUJR_25500 [Streptomyces sp. NPDC057271]|uniref:hypothetical protein n=1 Tax=unclassified Streptomyces TaxID=2593676 RepID=UPI00362AE4D7
MERPRQSGEETSPVHELFTLGTLLPAEPRRPVLRRFHGPRLQVVAEDGTVLAHLHEHGALAYVLQDFAGRSLPASTSSPRGHSPGPTSG